jgi:hypothetical protein
MITGNFKPDKAQDTDTGVSATLTVEARKVVRQLNDARGDKSAGVDRREPANRGPFSGIGERKGMMASFMTPSDR